MNTILFFDLFAATYLLFLGFNGFKNGYILEIANLLGLIVTIWISIAFYLDLAASIQLEFGFNPVATLFLSFFTIFGLTFIVTRIIISLLDQAIGVRKIRAFNQIFGFVIGTIKGFILLTVVLWIFELLPYQKWTDTLYENSTIARSIRYVRNSTIESFGMEDPIKDGKEYIRSLISVGSEDEDNEK
jgi:membrane protein required for colicin V production